MATSIVEQDLSLLFRKTADEYMRHLQAVQDSTIVLAFPGGRSVVGLLSELLLRIPQLSESMRSRLRFYVLDERVVSLDHPDSNFRLLQENLFAPLVRNKVIAENQVHPVQVSSADRVAQYDAELARDGGRFHLIVLGVGEDAHVAGLFPGHKTLSEMNASFVELTDSPKPPPHRMSASVGLLLKSDVAFALFTGSGKREALKKYKNSAENIQSCPAKLIDRIQLSYVVTDQVDL